MEVSLPATQRPRPWLDRLKQLQRDAVPRQQADTESAERLVQRRAKSDISPAPADEVATFEDAVAWRVAALRPHVARIGPLDPIHLPPVREGVLPLCEQDPLTGDITYHKHCGSCGEPREVGQIYHCRACQRAHHLVLLELREGVPIAALAQREGAA